ncbi:MAG: hemerythrin domain-containing protein [Candidatus Omnitrophica bacterium]|nr:hemerythrin domain-containing protein [Candidatus Omnitrophota bacterium]
MDFKEMQKRDPVTQQGEKGLSSQELSPMDPPDAYAPPGTIEEIPRAQMHPVLQEFYEEHDQITDALVKFEKALVVIQTEGITKEADEGIRTFFEFFDTKFIEHDKREEKILFPLLAKRLVEQGEHSQGPVPTTAIDMMEGDHLKAIQLAGIVFNFFGLSVRLPDERSRMIVLDAAIEQGKTLVELLRLHIFRENSIVFPLGHKYIKTSEFDQMPRKEAVSVTN